MGLAMRTAVTVTLPVLTGALVWWGVMLAVPVLLIRRWRRRARDAPGRWRRPSAARAGQALTPPLSPDGLSSGGAAPGQGAAAPARRAEGAEETWSAGGALRVEGPTPARPGRADVTRAGSLCDETLKPLCQQVDFRRRLGLAVNELESRLARLPADRWRIEPYPLTGERRNTLLLLGETGVFVISATYAPGHWDDVVAASRLARKVQLLLPGYPEQVQPAICHPFSCARPRLWHRPDEHGEWVGAWVLGGDSVIDWLAHFGTEHCLPSADLERFDELSKANWLKPAIPGPPSWPPVRGAAPPGGCQ